MLTGFLSSVFGQAFKDILSGYRVFSRRFVKSFPVLSDGFEIETELSVHALELALPVAEIETPYYARPEGSFSKLNTWRDGFRILGTILKLYRSEKPLRFFTAIGMFLTLVSIGLAIPIIVTYLEVGLVPRLPTAVLSMGLMILAMLSVSSGLVLDTVTRGRREMKLLAYLSQPRQQELSGSDFADDGPRLRQMLSRATMSDLSLTILAETANDAQAIERLHERTFGPGRFVLSAYRIREHVDHLLDLSFTARIGTLLVGSVRQLPICVGDTPALLLAAGPLTVEPPFRSRGVGRAAGIARMRSGSLRCCDDAHRSQGTAPATGTACVGGLRRRLRPPVVRPGSGAEGCAKRHGRSCRDRSTTTACWWRSSSTARSPTSPARSGRTGAWRASASEGGNVRHATPTGYRLALMRGLIAFSRDPRKQVEQTLELVRCGLLGWVDEKLASRDSPRSWFAGKRSHRILASRSTRLCGGDRRSPAPI